MDLALLTKSIEEIGALAKAGNVEVTKQLAAITEYRTKSDARLLALEQQPVGGAPGKPGRIVVPNLGEIVAKGIDLDKFRSARPGRA